METIWSRRKEATSRADAVAGAGFAYDEAARHVELQLQAAESAEQERQDTLRRSKLLVGGRPMRGRITCTMYALQLSYI